MSNDKPNIVWIGLDQMRWDTAGCYGNPVCQTPNIDRLAQKGVRFSQAYTPCSLCSPARASMFTGRYAFRHGMLTNCDLYHYVAAELSEPNTLLHSRLLAAGYRCGFVGKWHVGTRKGPVDYGFEGMNVPGYGNIRREPDFLAYLEKRSLRYSIEPDVFANPGEQTLLSGVWKGPTESTPAYYLAERTNELIYEFARSNKPFFLTCQFWGPHEPHLPSSEYAGLHNRRRIGPWINFVDSWQGKPERVRRTHTDFYRDLPQTWERWREVVGAYYDQTTMIDTQIGRILTRLEELGLQENTVIVLTADHGDMTGSHGGMNDKGFLYEEAQRIPLIVVWPGGFSDGLQRNELVYNMDIFPTLLDLLGMRDDSLDGRSLIPYLGGSSSENTPRDAVYLEFHGIRFLYSQRGIVTKDGWKYIFTPGDRDELYDLNTDPGELCNLLATSPTSEIWEKAIMLQEEMMQLAVESEDPLQVGINKFFGHWDRPSTQPEPSQL